VITGGYRLPARHVIHTVAPIWSGDTEKRERDVSLLGDCYRHALALARTNGIWEIAFPCLGTGVYGWPPDLAARTALDAVSASLDGDEQFSRIVFCCFSRADKDRYATLIAAPAGE
jgi:O-acetyl-ADP-ribose deacetylase (regulator of RNase III)